MRSKLSVRALPASPLGEGERTEVRGFGTAQRQLFQRQTLTLTLSLSKGEASRRVWQASSTHPPKPTIDQHYRYKKGRSIWHCKTIFGC